MCHNRYIEYTLMYIGYECVGYECICYIEYNEYSFMYFITNISISHYLRIKSMESVLKNNFEIFLNKCFYYVFKPPFVFNVFLPLYLYIIIL